MLRRQPPAFETVVREAPFELLDRRDGAGDDTGLGPVVGGHRKPRAEAGLDLRRRQRHRQHGAGGAVRHQPRADGDQRQGVLEGEDARQARGHVLAVGVTEHGPRTHTPGHPQLRQSVLEGEERRQGDVDPSQALLGFAPPLRRGVENGPQIEARVTGEEL